MKSKTAPSEIVQVLIEKTLDPKESATYGIYAQLMGWADKLRRLQIRTNADQPDQVANAVAFGAQGVGLCRTEHMFFEGDRIDAVREMILADTKEGRETAVAKLLPYQRGDFAGIFRSLNGLPATIRLLDPPLHEFLPHTHDQQAELAHKLGVPVEKVTRRVAELHEFNPMLGLRGCRLGIIFPEISAMQVRAIFEAAIEVQKEGIKVKPEIMIPLVGFAKELELQVALVRQIAAEVSKQHNIAPQLPRGHHDRNPARLRRRRRDRQGSRVLQLRHERSHPDHARHEPRRFRLVPARLPEPGDHQAESVRHDRHRPASAA